MSDATFPPGFFDRWDDSPDPVFYTGARLVTHLDDAAIAAVGDLYEELGLADGQVLDLMSSWVSHFRRRPAHLTVLGLNAEELAANPQADERLVRDLNVHPELPFEDAAYDCATCCVSVDYLVRPVEVFAEVARVLRPGAPFVLTYSNRCFPAKAIRGWLATSDEEHGAIVAAYFRLAGGWSEPVVARRTPRGHRGDPLWAVWARRVGASGPDHGPAQAPGDPGEARVEREQP